jgi:hypothetical protein
MAIRNVSFFRTINRIIHKITTKIITIFCFDSWFSRSTTGDNIPHNIIAHFLCKPIQRFDNKFVY